MDGDVEVGVIGYGAVVMECDPGMVCGEGDGNRAEGGIILVSVAGEVVMRGDFREGEGTVVDCNFVNCSISIGISRTGISFSNPYGRIIISNTSSDIGFINFLTVYKESYKNSIK